ncbi:putative quinol monooxygenase [Algisphaera agarilytica]|uniref:Quinol monooxygenase YgiN n=1 Tax=Algisphaera agarilytica TaxID=1385975 RepID=A0A7X0LIZ3_9BACT|nr:putative quinol monooxygenase [Algisphaera agarilytica]MBB6428312.1 quinol monooxygenase YgiN [Algisphaera agarilytica]
MSMYVVTVLFEVAPEHVDSFRPEMLKQAENSLKLEPGCHQFDVCFDAEDPGKCFLYEKYTDRAAFDVHLASDHFKTFSETVADWVTGKTVHVWLETPAS